MAQARFVAYYRISGTQPARPDLDLEAQRAAIRAYLDGGTSQLAAEFHETEERKNAYTLDRRPQLRAALDFCRTEKATLIFARLGRLARNRYFATGLIESGVDFVVADAPHASRCMLQALIAPQERAKPTASASEPIAEVMARRARRSNVGFIRGNASSPKGQAIVDHYADQIRDVLIALRARGLSRWQIVAELNMLGVAPPRGVRWDLEAVQQLLAREKPEMRIDD